MEKGKKMSCAVYQKGYWLIHGTQIDHRSN